LPYFNRKREKKCFEKVWCVGNKKTHIRLLFPNTALNFFSVYLKDILSLIIIFFFCKKLINFLNFSKKKIKGVINAEGKLWKDQRRFLHEKLRRFGMTYLNSKNSKLQTLISVSNFQKF
jgi:hypothetical protein